MVISYDGTNYVGWQTQPNGTAIQAVIEHGLSVLTGESIVLHASGRTDSGVHAKAQTAHFDTLSRIPPDKFSFALNALLPRDIRIMYSEEAKPDFHARFSAKRKAYRYTIQTGAHQDPFLRNTALFVHCPLDIDVMQKEAECLLGEHDFAAFRSSGTVNKTTVRTIYSSQWSKCGNILHYDVTGSGFLYNMVRILADTMLDVGSGRLPVGSVAKALDSRERGDAGATAPPCGLMLMRVVYPDFDTEEVFDQ